MFLLPPNPKKNLQLPLPLPRRDISALVREPSQRSSLTITPLLAIAAQAKPPSNTHVTAAVADTLPSLQNKLST
jgi:hypothetical protein